MRYMQMTGNCNSAAIASGLARAVSGATQRDRFGVRAIWLTAALLCLHPGQLLAADTSPDPLVFPSVTGAQPGSLQTSNTVTVSGIDTPAPAAVAGGSYSINGGAYTQGNGAVVNGDKLTLRQTASANYSSSTTATLTVGGVSGAFKVTTRAVDTTPDAYSFTAISNAEPGAVRTSNSITVGGVDIPVTISITNGSYSINDGAFTAAAGTVNNGDRVSLAATASSSFGGSVTATAKIGTLSGAFKVATRAADTTPDAFSFAAVADADPGVARTSNSIVVSGVEIPVTISVSGGSYSINEGAFTTSASTVKNGDRVSALATASSSSGSSVTATVKIGTISGAYKVTTRAADTTPDAFSFAAVTDATPGSAQISNTVTVTGINAPTSISASGGSYNVNGGAFTTASGTVNNGDRVSALATASSSSGGSVTATIKIGTISGAYKVTTRAVDTTPDAFSFAAVTDATPGSAQISNTVTVTGINAPASISASGGSYSVNGADFTLVSGKVDQGDSVRLQLVAASSSAGTATASLSIGGVSGSFKVTTRTADTTPDPFVFAAVTDATPGSTQTSNTITVTGINAPASISVSGGSYSVNGADFTTASGKVNQGDSVSLRLVASSSSAGTATASLSIGGVSGAFKVTTRTADTTPDPFVFAAVTDATPGSTQISNTVTVTGIDAPTVISASGGSYNINDGAFTTAAGTVNNGDRVSALATASSSSGSSVTATVKIGTLSGAFKVTTRVADTTPDLFVFAAVTDAAPGSTQTSNTITVTGINALTGISVSGGSYNINDGAFTTAAGTVNNGDRVSALAKASSTSGSSVTATVKIGALSGAYKVTTRAADTTPDPFAFAAVTDAAPGSTQISSAITVTGIDAPTNVSVSGGSYNVNGNAYGTASGKVNAGDIVTLSLIASSQFLSSTTATLTVGGIPASFKVTTRGSDTTPDPFSFNAKTGVPTGSTQISDAVIVTGINAPANISISGGSYSINSGSYATGSGRVNVGDSVTLRQVASSAYGTTTTATLTIGGVSAVSSITTLPADTTPDAFSFTPVVDARIYALQTSDAITVSGINAVAPITITGGSYSVNGGAYTAVSNTVANGSRITVRQTSATSNLTTTTTTLTIGGVSGSFSVTTRDAPSSGNYDRAPDLFRFQSVSGAAPGSLVTSNEIVVTGIDGPVPISVVDGTYSLNDADFTSSPGTAMVSDRIRVQVTAAGGDDDSVLATLSVGTLSTTFSVGTLKVDLIPTGFSFAPTVGADPGSTQTSATITVSGINLPTSISVIGGAYSINGAPYTTDDGMVVNRDQVNLQVTAPPDLASTAAATLSIGGLSADYFVSTVGANSVPDPFSLTWMINAAQLVNQISNDVIVSGINVPTPISISAGSYRINGGDWLGGIRAVNNGDVVNVRLAAPAGYSKSAMATLNIGGQTATFALTTADPGSLPQPSTILDLSHWKLTTPIDSNGGTSGSPLEVSAANLANYSADWFYSTVDGGVAFWSPSTGTQTSSAKYPRSELRELLDPTSDTVNWNDSGQALLKATLAVNQAPSAGGRIVIGQIHGYGDVNPLIKLQYTYDANAGVGSLDALINAHPDNDSELVRFNLASGVGLNQLFSYRIAVAGQQLSMSVNDAPPAVYSISDEWTGLGLYFKAGSYVQAKTSSGPEDGGRVTFYILEATHPAGP